MDHAATAEFCAGIRGLSCQGVERYGPGLWQFSFDQAARFTIECPWRVLVSGGIVLSRDDDGQLFGRREPVDVELEAISLLGGSPVIEVVIASGTADLRVSFANGTMLEAFNNSMAYEGWTASLTVEGRDIHVSACGGGKVASWG